MQTPSYTLSKFVRGSPVTSKTFARKLSKKRANGQRFFDNSRILDNR